MNALLTAALVWIGQQIAAFTYFLQGVMWAALAGAMTGGSDWWDDLSNYNMTDWGHIGKIVAPAMFASISQWVVGENKRKQLLAEQALDYERQLLVARMKP